MPDLPEQLHQRPGTEVAVRSSGGAVAPYNVDNSEGLTAGDLLIPRMKIVQKMSRVLDDELAEYGAIYVLTSREDMEPEILAAPPKKGELGPAVRFYVLGDPVKGWSWTDPDNSLQRSTTYPNLDFVMNNDPRRVNRTYRYLLSVPSYPQLPVTFLMYGAWGGNSAKWLNTQLVLARSAGRDPSEIAFKLQAMKAVRSVGGQDQPYVKGIVGFDKVPAKDKAKDQEIVEQHRLIVSQSNATMDDDVVQQAEQAEAAAAATAPSLD